MEAEDFFHSLLFPLYDEWDIEQTGSGVVTRSAAAAAAATSAGSAATPAVPPPSASLSLDPGETPEEGVKIVKVKHKKSRKFAMEESSYHLEVKQHESNDVREGVTMLKSSVNEILDSAKESYEGDDQMFFSLTSRELKDPIVLPLMPVRELTADAVIGKIENVVQSNEDFVLKGEFDVQVCAVKNVAGGGFFSKTHFEEAKKKEPLVWVRSIRGLVGHESECSLAGALYYAGSEIDGTGRLVRRSILTSVERKKSQIEDIQASLEGDLHYSAAGKYVASQFNKRLIVLEWTRSNDDFVYWHPGDFEEDCFLYVVEQSGHRYHYFLRRPSALFYRSSGPGFCRKCVCFYDESESLGRGGRKRKMTERSGHDCKTYIMKKKIAQASSQEVKRELLAKVTNKRVKRDSVLFYHNKRSVIHLESNDNVCCARALLTAMDVKSNPNQGGSHWSRMYGLRMRERIAELHANAGVPVGQPCSKTELEQFQRFLAPNYQIHVLYAHMANQVGFRGDEELFRGSPDRQHLYLHHSNDHYDVITSPKGFFVAKHYCEECDVVVHHLNRHKCRTCCFHCKRSGQDCPDSSAPSTPRRCSECRCLFKNETCFAYHQQAIHKWKRVKLTPPENKEEEEEEEMEEREEREPREAVKATLWEDTTVCVIGTDAANHVKKWLI